MRFPISCYNLARFSFNEKAADMRDNDLVFLRFTFTFAFVLFGVLLFSANANAQSEVKNGAKSQTRNLGIVNKKAPEWTVDKWQQLPDKKTKLALKDLEGKVVYAYFFQSWCPGCHSRGFPNMVEVQKKFAGDDDVVFVTIQTVFEGKQTNTSARALATAKKFKLDIPVGHAVSAGSGHSSPKIMKDYRTGGTPWTVIIDKQGVVRANDFTIDPENSIKLINNLKNQR